MSNTQANGSMWKKYFLVCLLTTAKITFLVSQINTVFYTQFLEIFGINNTQLGFTQTMSILGCIIGSTIGGVLADRAKNPKNLVVAACFVTGVACFIEAFLHTYAVLLLIYFLFSLSQFVLMSNANLKCISLIGTPEEQGKLFGVAESAYAAVSLIFNYGFLALISLMGLNLLQALYVVGGICILLGFALHFFLHLPQQPQTAAQADKPKQKASATTYLKVLKMPVTWCNALVFSSLYLFSTFLFSYTQPRLVSVYLMDAAVASGVLLLIRSFLRIVLGPIGGSLRDKVGDSFKIMIPFSIISIVLGLINAFLPMTPGSNVVIYFAILITSAVCMYLMSPLQYTLAADAKVPSCYNGTVWGVSTALSPIMGLWVAPVCGILMDNYGAVAYRYIALFMVAAIAVGLIAVVVLRNCIRKGTSLGKEVQAEVDAGLIS